MASVPNMGVFGRVPIFKPPKQGPNAEETILYSNPGIAEEDYIPLKSKTISSKLATKGRERVKREAKRIAELPTNQRGEEISDEGFLAERTRKNVDYNLKVKGLPTEIFDELEEKYSVDDYINNTNEDVIDNEINEFVSESEDLIKDFEEDKKEILRDIYRRKFVSIVQKYVIYKSIYQNSDKAKFLENVNNKIIENINSHKKNTPDNKNISVNIKMPSLPSVKNMTGSTATVTKIEPRRDSPRVSSSVESPRAPSPAPSPRRSASPRASTPTPDGAIANTAASSPLRNATTPTVGSYQDSIIKKNIERVILEKGYKRDGEPIIVSDSDTIAIYYLAAIDPYGTKVYISMQDAIGSIELKENDMRNKMKKQSESKIPSSTRSAAFSSGYPIMLTQGNEYCAILMKDNGEPIYESFVDSSDCNDLKVNIPIGYPIVSLNEIKYNTKETMDRCLKQYQASMNGLFESNKKKLEETIKETKKLTDAISIFNDNRKIAYDSIIKNRNDFIKHINENKSQDVRDRDVYNIRKRNSTFEDYVEIYNKISNNLPKIQELYENVKDLNNQLVDAHAKVKDVYFKLNQ
jgi:hypothetical protein